MIRWFFVKSSLNASYYDNWSISGHWKPFFKSLDKLPPSGLKPDPDLTLPHIDISACLFLTKVRRLSCASCRTDDLLQEGLCHLPKVQNRLNLVLLITLIIISCQLFFVDYFCQLSFATSILIYAGTSQRSGVWRPSLPPPLGDLTKTAPTMSPLLNEKFLEARRRRRGNILPDNDYTP